VRCALDALLFGVRDTACLRHCRLSSSQNRKGSPLVLANVVHNGAVWGVPAHQVQTPVAFAGCRASRQDSFALDPSNALEAYQRAQGLKLVGALDLVSFGLAAPRRGAALVPLSGSRAPS